MERYQWKDYRVAEKETHCTGEIGYRRGSVRICNMASPCKQKLLNRERAWFLPTPLSHPLRLHNGKCLAGLGAAAPLFPEGFGGKARSQ